MFNSLLKHLLKENTNVGYKYSCLKLQVPNEIAEKILKFGLEIPEEEIYNDETNQYGRELDCHITIKYGFTTNDVKELDFNNLADNYPKNVHVKLGIIDIFPGEENDKPYDVVKIFVESEDLLKLNKIVSKLKNKDTHPDYKPHCTIAYVKKGMGKKYVGKEDFNNLTFISNKLEFSSADGVKTKLEL